MAAKKKKDKIEVDKELKILLEADEMESVAEFVSTGSTLLDYAISNRPKGGIPVGRITELIGENQAGKTLVGTHILANTQKMGGIAIAIDTEHDMDKDFSYRIGLNWDGVIYKEYLQCLEDVFEYLDKIIRVTRLKHKSKLITILWDSIAATPARTELEGGYDPTKIVGLHARIMSSNLRRIRSSIKSERIALVCTNQLRTKIGVSFGDPNITAHGRAMHFYASVRIKLLRTGQLKNNAQSRIHGAECKATVIKNKVGPCWRSVEYPIYYDYGINDGESFLKYLKSKDVVVTKGAWSYIKVPTGGGKVREVKFQGAPKWNELLRSDLEFQKYVFREINAGMIVNPERRPDDWDIDIDSILDMDQVRANQEGA